MNAFSNIVFKALFVILVLQLLQKYGESSTGMLHGGCSSALSSFLLSLFIHIFFLIFHACVFKILVTPKFLQVQVPWKQLHIQAR